MINIMQHICVLLEQNSKKIFIIKPQIDANAGDGSITVDGALLSAQRGARFDHAHGTIENEDSTVEAPVLVTWPALQELIQVLC
jgi:hypothetical protein